LKLQRACQSQTTSPPPQQNKNNNTAYTPSRCSEAQRVLRRTISDYELFDLQVFPRTDTDLPEYDDVERASVPANALLRKESGSMCTQKRALHLSSFDELAEEKEIGYDAVSNTVRLQESFANVVLNLGLISINDIP
jgi:hypothetical protein